MNWIILALLAPALWAITNVLDKIVVTRYIKNYYTIAIIFGLSNFIALLFYPLAEIELKFWPMLASILAGILSLAAAMPYYKALYLEEASKLVPIWNSVPLVVLIMEWLFLSQILSLNFYISFFLIIIGTFIISI